MVPPPPHDFVIGHKEKRRYRDPNTLQMTITSKPENVYFHTSQTCIRLRHPYFIPSMLHVAPSVVGMLSPTHKIHLRSEFGIMI